MCGDMLVSPNLSHLDAIPAFENRHDAACTARIGNLDKLSRDPFIVRLAESNVTTIYRILRIVFGKATQIQSNLLEH